MCREDGIIMVDGVLLRTGEQEFITYFMAPYIQYAFEKGKKEGKYNALGENLSGSIFLYQVAGPHSLQILEKAAQRDLHDLKFMHHKKITIAGKDVTILRLGMAGTLAYEIHGNIEHGNDVYEEIWKSGQEDGLIKLGNRAYMMNHTENGFPQAYYHFPYPWRDDEGFSEWLGPARAFGNDDKPPVGSAGTDMSLRYRSPVDLGWEKKIKFDHDFTGRKSLEKLVAERKTTVVTLKWNVEDILDVHRSQFEQGEHYMPMDTPNDRLFKGKEFFHADKVLDKDGNLIGISSGRCYSYYFRDMISLCTIKVEYAEIGKEVVVVWGNPGTRQKNIRAVVSRFPYLDQGRNEKIGTDHVPAFKAKN
jgi:glycine cleavage system aminomethyltransferase T